MISIRSATTLFSVSRHGGGVRLARFRPTATAGGTIHQETVIKDHPATTMTTTTTTRRQLTSLANRRYIKKNQMFWDQSPSDGYSGKGGKLRGGYRQRGGQRIPSLLVAKAMPVGFSAMDNEPLLTIAEMGNHSARIEVLKRHIMAVDGVDYDEACETFQLIADKNKEGHTSAALPYQIGIFVALTAGFGSIPLVFHLDTAMWFNEHYVTQDLPDASDLDTFLGTCRTRIDELCPSSVSA
jgi:hypothetical protein